MVSRAKIAPVLAPVEADERPQADANTTTQLPNNRRPDALGVENEVVAPKICEVQHNVEAFLEELGLKKATWYRIGT